MNFGLAPKVDRKAVTAQERMRLPSRMVLELPMS